MMVKTALIYSVVTIYLGRLGRPRMNPLNHKWLDFAIWLGLTLHQFQKKLLLNTVLPDKLLDKEKSGTLNPFSRLQGYVLQGRNHGIFLAEAVYVIGVICLLISPCGYAHVPNFMYRAICLVLTYLHSY